MSTKTNIDNPIKDDEGNHDNNINGGGNNRSNNGGEPRNRQACAACKYNRKKCVQEDCAMWNHFLVQKAQQFAAVQNIFGLKNLTKDLNEQQQEEAIKAFEWEAMCWKDDPVHGPLGQYKKLEEANRQLMARNYNLELHCRFLMHQLSSIQHQQLPLCSPQSIGFRVLPPGTQHGYENLNHSPNNGVFESDFLNRREQSGQDVRFGPIMRRLTFQGSALQQLNPLHLSPNHDGPRGAVNGMRFPRPHAIPNHPQNLYPSPMHHGQQITTPANQHHPPNPSSTADPTKTDSSQ